MQLPCQTTVSVLSKYLQREHTAKARQPRGSEDIKILELSAPSVSTETVASWEGTEDRRTRVAGRGDLSVIVNVAFFGDVDD